MGGLLIIMVVNLSTLLWAVLANPFVWLALLTILSLGMVGFVDDFL